MRRLLSGLVIIMLLGGCGDDDRQTPDDHVLQEQTEALERAREVDQLIEETAERQRRAIDEQGR